MIIKPEKQNFYNQYLTLKIKLFFIKYKNLLCFLDEKSDYSVYIDRF